MTKHPSPMVGLGEILWNVFPDAPRFGGAPANFAGHVAALGAAAEMISAVGPDELGKRAFEKLHARRVGTSRWKRSEGSTVCPGFSAYCSSTAPDLLSVRHQSRRGAVRSSDNPPFDWGERLPSPVSHSRPIFMSSRDFD